MQKFWRIVYHAIISTSRHPRWWIFGVFQAVAFALIGKFARPEFFGNFWLAAGIILLPTATVLLWLEAAASREKAAPPQPDKNFIFRKIIFAAAITFIISGILLLARWFFVSWPVLALAISLLGATGTLWALYGVLCGQKFFPSLLLAVKTWNKKFSLGAVVAAVLILANGAAFVLTHVLWDTRILTGEFSVFEHSATIWILLLVLIVGTAYLVAFLNCFLVYLFLEIIQMVKTPSVAKTDTALEMARGHI